jgi:hypothetical protein
MYSNLTLFKQYLGIDVNDTTNDVLLTQFLNSATSKINNLCWVDSFDEWEYTEEIDWRKVIATSRWFEIYLKNKPVQQIEQINWVEYTWVHGTDYMIIYDRRIILKEVSLNDFWFVNIKYKAWYNRDNEWVDELPDDLKLMEMMLASGMWQQHNYEWVSSYKLGDESITFGSKGDASADDQYFTFTTLLNKYKNFILPV